MPFGEFIPGWCHSLSSNRQKCAWHVPGPIRSFFCFFSVAWQKPTPSSVLDVRLAVCHRFNLKPPFLSGLMTSSRVTPVFHFLYTCLSQRSSATPREELDRLCAIFSFYCCGARQQSPGHARCSHRSAPESLGWLGGLGLDRGCVAVIFCVHCHGGTFAAWLPGVLSCAGWQPSGQTGGEGWFG